MKSEEQIIIIFLFKGISIIYEKINIPDLTVKNLIEVKIKVEKIIEDKKYIELNFVNSNYVDSSGISFLINLFKKLKKIGGNLRVSNVNKDIIEIFKITQVYETIEVI